MSEAGSRACQKIDSREDTVCQSVENKFVKCTATNETSMSHPHICIDLHVYAHTCTYMHLHI